MALGFNSYKGEDGQWHISDRFSRHIDGEGPFPDDRQAQRRADDLNRMVIERRLRS